MSSEIKDELQSIKSEISKQNISNTNNEKSNSEIIIEKNISNLESFLNNKIINIYQRPWNKLEIKLKKNKIKEFLNEELNNNNIDKLEFETLITKYNSLINSNKKIKVNYDVEQCKIIKID